jgi:3-oxoacyl-[acyl-carrier protein] reductase
MERTGDIMNLEGKLAIVTGGTSGIGRAIAVALVKAGADVVICGRNEDTAIKTAKIISDELNANCLGLPCDVRDLDAVKHMLDMATEVGTSNIDILVNNAGIAGFAPIREMTAETWHQVIDTNLNGTFNMIHGCLPHLAADAFIFNIESIAAVHPFATGAAYNASKAAVHAMSEAIMLELRSEGKRVTSILPGSVNTKLEGPNGRSHQPWKMEPEDIAKVVIDCLGFPARAMPSKIEVRPTKTKGS